MIRTVITKVKRHRGIKKAYQLAFKIVGLLPKKNNLIIFESFLGKQYSCNPRAIYEYIELNDPNYEMYWSVDPRYSESFREKGIKTVNRFSIPWLFKMARAKYWVFNSRTPSWIPKPKKTVYLQTWHGTPLKKLAADMDEVHMPGTDTERYKRNFLNESQKWDYLISPNKYSSEIFQRAFNFNKEMIESGYPRNDFLLLNNNLEMIEGIKRKLKIPTNKKVILYAPTWRDNEYYSVGKYKFNLKLDLEKMREELGNQYVILMRMHYLIAENMDLSMYETFVKDVSSYEDIRELYLISDILITDYSSVFFDYGNLKRPMIFFTYDIDSYRDQLRGFYFDFEKEAPGPLVKTTKEVLEEIKLIEEGKGLDSNFNQFFARFCHLEDGTASKQIVEKVFKENN